MIKARAIKNALPTILFGLVMLCLTVYIYFPGLMSMDSVSQLKQAEAFVFTDWHPPTMAFLWFLLNHIYFGPASMLVFHNLLYYSALLLFVFLIFPTSNLYRIILVFIFTFFPPIFSQLGIIWKDVSFSMSMFLVTILLIYFPKVNSKVYKWILCGLIIVLLFYAFSVRINFFPVIIIYCFWFSGVAFSYKKIWWNIFLSLILFGAIFSSNKLLIDFLTQHKSTYPSQQVKIHDLTAVSLAKKIVLFPDEMINSYNITLKKISKNYSPLSVVPFATAMVKVKGFRGMHELNKLWLKIILTNPEVYLKHRIYIFKYLLINANYENKNIIPNKWGFVFRESALFKWYYNIMDIPIYRINILGKMHKILIGYLFSIGVFYWLLCLSISMAMLFKKMKLPESYAILFISISGFLYGAAYFICAPACDFRYLYWTVIAALISLILLIKNGRNWSSAPL